MRILVTGGAGFIGSHIVDALIKMQHEVIIVDDLSTGVEKNINKKAKFFKLDISNKKKLENVFKKEIDIIFHTAAQIDVRKASIDPARDAEINIIGTINILKHAVDYNVKKIIFSSTGGAMYGDVEEPAKENTLPSPKSPYGISKYSDEMYIRFFGEEYSLGYTILRYANVYGPRQISKGEAGVISIFIESMMKNKEITLYGFGNMIRDFVYVDDVVEANILSITKGNKQILNVGTGVKTKIRDLYNYIKEYFPDYNHTPIKKDKRPGEIFSSVLDGTAILRDYDKEDYIDIKEGIKKTVKWFKEENSGK